MESPPPKRSAPFLPIEMMLEILSRTPIKSLCRFRCVSREWRTLIADQTFVAAHKSRVGPLPLLAGCYSDPTIGMRLMDMDGKVVRDMKMVDVRASFRPFCQNVFDDRICLVGYYSVGTHMIDLATGEVLFDAQELNQGKPMKVYNIIGAGHAAMSGALKVVCVTQIFDVYGNLKEHVCEVLELDRAAAGSGDRRASQSPPTEPGDRFYRCDVMEVDGVVHFLTVKGKVLRFDLETEQWRKTVGGPPVEEGTNETHITKLSGALCMVAHWWNLVEPTRMDIWRLDDPEKSTWVKAYTVPMRTYRFLMPLMVTPDGGKLLFSGVTFNAPEAALLLVYDLGDKTWNVRTTMPAHDILVRLVLCRLHLDHFLL